MELNRLKKTFSNKILLIILGTFIIKLFLAFLFDHSVFAADEWTSQGESYEPEEGFQFGILPIILIAVIAVLAAVNIVMKRRKGDKPSKKAKEVEKEKKSITLPPFISKLLGKGSSAPILGIDITNESIIIAQLNQTKSGFELLNLVSANTPQNAIRDGEIIDTSAVAETIQELMESNDITATQAITTVSGQAVITRTVKFPAMSAKELKEVILHESERYIPFPIDDVNIDFQTLREVEDEGINKVEVLLVAAQKQFINSYVETFIIAGLKLLTVDVASFAVARSLTEDNNVALGGGEPIVLVLIRGETTDITVFQNGIPRFSRSIPIGSTSFIETIASNLSISLEEAIDIFDQVVVPIAGQSVSEEPLVEMASNEIRTTLRELTTEIQRSLEYFQSQDMVSVQHMVLSGRGSKIKNLDKHFSMNLGIDVEIGNPLSYIQFDEEEFSAEYLMDNATIFATSLGLAKRGVEIAM